MRLEETQAYMEELRAVMEREHLTRSDVARELNMRPSTICRWLDGETCPTVRSLPGLVKMLNQYRSRLACDGCRFWQALEGTSLYACHRALYTDKLRATVVGGKLRWMPKWQCYRPGWGPRRGEMKQHERYDP
jgi:hypothetical protein